MNTCNSCVFWAQNKLGSSFYNDGQCRKMNDKVYAQITYGWDGGLFEYFETERDFGCNLYEHKTEAIE